MNNGQYGEKCNLYGKPCLGKNKRRPRKLLLVGIIAVICSLLMITAGCESNNLKSDSPQQSDTLQQSGSPQTTVPETAAPENVTVYPMVEPEDVFEDVFSNKKTEELPDMPFLGQTEYIRRDVQKVIFTGSLDDAPESAWDVSAEGNGTVKAWMSSGTLYIGADGKIGLNENSQCLFTGFINMESIEWNDSVSTENVQDMGYMFCDCTSLVSLDLSSFRTENVQNMRYMFRGCESLTSLDLSSFQTGNVQDMKAMFAGCTSLVSLDLSSFRTENVQDMGYMFYDCTSLVSLDLSNFRTENVQNMDGMFEGLQSLNICICSDARILEMFADTEGLTIISTAQQAAQQETSADETVAPYAPADQQTMQTVIFGSCEQDNNTGNGKEAIEWLVLEVQGDRALVISRYILNRIRFTDDTFELDWDKCYARSMLNESFLMDAFSAAEQQSIIPNEVRTVSGWSGNESVVQDKLFFLSEDDLIRYFPAAASRICYPTAYARNQSHPQDPIRNTDGPADWLLRDATTLGTPKTVDESGATCLDYGITSLCGFRPAMWVKTEALQ